MSVSMRLDKIIGVFCGCFLGAALLGTPARNLRAQESPPPSPEDQKVQQQLEETAQKVAEKGDMEGGPLKLRIEGSVDLNYVFADSPDSFVVIYKFKIEQPLYNTVEIRKGDLEITTEVKGFLAKWPLGACELTIAIPKVPYEIIFNRVKENEARAELKIRDTIQEDWESHCQFSDAPGAKFNTRGAPERWIDGALKKTIPSFRRLVVPIQLNENKPIPFKIETYQAPDIPLGSVELEGKGLVSIQRL